MSRVNHPSYYLNENSPYVIVELENGEKKKVPIECIDVIRNMPSWKGNAIKYLWREGNKVECGFSNVEKEIEDLEKSIWYIQDKINELKEVSKFQKI